MLTRNPTGCSRSNVPTHQGSEGSVLLLTMLLLSGLILTGAAVYVSGIRNLRSSGNHVRNIQSYYQAEAGGKYVIDRLGTDILAGTVLLDQALIAVNYQPPSGYNFDPVTQLIQLGDDRAYLFEVTGRAGLARNVLEIVFRSPQGAFGDFFSDDTMTLSGGASLTGNARGNNDIVNSGGSQIFGDATPGPGFSVSDPANVTGDTMPASSPLVIPPIDPSEVAAAMAGNNNWALDPAYYNAGAQEFDQSGGNYTMPAGTYYFTEFRTSGGAITSIGGPVTIYCSGRFVVSGGGFTNPFNNPDDLVIKSVAVNEVVEWSGSSDCHARVYAPTASEAKVTGGGTFTGTIITAGKLTASGGSTLVGSGSAFGSGGPGVIVSAWREVF